MPTVVIEALGFAIFAVWLGLGIAEYRKAKNALLNRRQIMARLAPLARYLYGSLILLGVIVLIWQWAVPTGHGAR